MKTLSAFAALGLVALAAGASFAFADAGGGNEPVQKLVFGGGRIPAGSCTDGPTSSCTAVTREFSVYAVSSPQDGGTRGAIIAGDSRHRGSPDVVRVTCFAVSGNTAEIGGVIMQAADRSTLGGSFRLFVRDSGQPGASPSFVDPPSAQAACRDVTSGAFGYGYMSFTDGGLVVRDG